MSIEDFNKHNIGDFYWLQNRNGSVEMYWKLAYSHPLPGTYKKGIWIDYTEPYALIEKPLNEGVDIREVPIRFLTRMY